MITIRVTLAVTLAIKQVPKEQEVAHGATSNLDTGKTPSWAGATPPLDARCVPVAVGSLPPPQAPRANAYCALPLCNAENLSDKMSDIL
jgi:hypothetical protein